MLGGGDVPSREAIRSDSFRSVPFHPIYAISDIFAFHTAVTCLRGGRPVANEAPRLFRFCLVFIFSFFLSSSSHCSSVRRWPVVFCEAKGMHHPTIQWCNCIARVRGEEVHACVTGMLLRVPRRERILIHRMPGCIVQEERVEVHVSCG